MPVAWKKASEIYKWEHRATQYHTSQVFEQFEYHKAKRYELWDKNYEIAQKAQEKVLKMLDFPLSKRTVIDTYPDGRERKVIIEPANWTFKDALIIAEKASSILKDIHQNIDADLMIEYLEKMGFKVVDPSALADSIETENLLKEVEILEEQ